MFTNEAENPPVTMSIKAWIEGLASGTDLLAKFDQSIDGSIGGLGRKTEAMYNSDRLVPLFEFRGLKDVPTSGFGDFMRRVDEAIQELHR